MQRLRRLVHALNLRLPARRQGVVFLTYHLVGAGTGSPVDLPREAFRAQLEALAPRVLPFSGAVEALARGEALEGPRVVLTFDDAYRNFEDVAWPELERLGLPAILYAPVDFLDGRGRVPIRGTEGLPPATWAGLRDLVATGRLEIGSHSRSHRNLTRIPPAELPDELGGARRALEDRLQVPVDSFCYPQGKRSRPVEDEVRRTYRTAVVSGGRALFGPPRLHRLGRLPVRRDTPADLGRVLERAVWVEEWVGAGLRRFRG